MHNTESEWEEKNSNKSHWIAFKPKIYFWFKHLFLKHEYAHSVCRLFYFFLYLLGM